MCIEKFSTTWQKQWTLISMVLEMSKYMRIWNYSQFFGNRNALNIYQVTREQTAIV